MRKEFSEYYKPTEIEFKALFENCIFVFDANVLLFFYRYSKDTSDKFLELLGKVSTRIWIPHQAAFEYQEDRLGVIHQQSEAYKRIKEQLKSNSDQIKKFLEENYSNHHIIKIDQIKDIIIKSIEEAEKYLDKCSADHPDGFKEDKIRERISKLFEGKVGEGFDKEKSEQIFKEGEERYKKEIPPGYKDIDKDKLEPTKTKKYGDLIIWYQIIDKAKKENKPIIFITDDSKEDWWWKVNKKTIGPRAELIREIRDKANVGFYMYNSERFIELLGENVKEEVKETIKEIKEVRESEERKKIEPLKTISFSDIHKYCNKCGRQYVSYTFGDDEPFCSNCRLLGDLSFSGTTSSLGNLTLGSGTLGSVGIFFPRPEKYCVKCGKQHTPDLIGFEKNTCLDCKRTFTGIINIEGSKHCSECGSKYSPPYVTGLDEDKCPNCHKRL